MVTFLTDLQVSPVGEQRWKLAADLVCDTRFGILTVPKRFVTDGASVPRPVWVLYPPMDGDYDAAAVLHDYAYRYATKLSLSRAQADGLLRDGMVATNTAARKRIAIYVAVRLGGGIAWSQRRKEENP